MVAPFKHNSRKENQRKTKPNPKATTPASRTSERTRVPKVRNSANARGDTATQKAKANQVKNKRRQTSPPKTYVDEYGKVKKIYRNLREEYIDRVQNVPKDRKNYGNAPAICYSSLGNSHNLAARPLGRLPSHIVQALNAHYILLSHGLMVPNADLYNNDDQPLEELFPAIIDHVEFGRLIREVEENENKAKILKTQKSAETPAKSPPTSANDLVHGEIIGKFVIYGSGEVARAVCCKTREVFTAHVIPDWKVPKVMQVIQRLQIPNDFTSRTDDEMRLSELCVSTRTEIIRSLSRFIIFLPTETNTVHSYAVERLDRITEKEAMAIFKKVVEIVRFCHSRRVLVRNFKPRNFYIKKDEKGEFIIRPAFLQDMWCEDDDADNLRGRRAVCVPYMAPEMLTTRRGKTLHCRTTEMWGLGVLLYILLTGKYPFHETEMPKLFRSIRFKQPRFPSLFVTRKSRNLVSMLLKKRTENRMELNELWECLSCDFPSVRCRSNLVLKQQDLLIKKKMFKMYWNAYKDRLLPQNVIPIKEELQSCLDDLPLMTEMARRDMRGVQETIRRNAKKHLTPYQTKVMEARLHQINQLLVERERKRAAKAGKEARDVRVNPETVSWELLLPRSLYPINDYYHPSQKPVDWKVYQVLKAAKQLRFPVIIRRGSPFRYPAPKFKGPNVSSRPPQQA